MANLIEMASRGARTLVDNPDDKKVLSSDCTICFATLNRDIDAYVKGAASVGSGGLSGIGNPPMPVTKSRRESRFKDCTEGHASKKAKVGPGEEPPLDVYEMSKTIFYNALGNLPRLKNRTDISTKPVLSFFLRPLMSLQFNAPTSR